MQTAETTPQRLGEFVQKTRTEKQFSYQQLADLTGLARNTIWKIEHGKIAQPRPEVLNSLGRALSIPAVDLFTLANYPAPDALPSFGAYLRARYQDLGPAQVAQLEGYFAAIAKQSNLSLDGPEPGEDEITGA